MIDHIMEAGLDLEVLEDWHAREGETDAAMHSLGIVAQVHATLALAEQTAELVKQQRIANLLAFVASVQSGVTTVLPSETVMRRVEFAGAQVVEGLGLS